MPPNAPMLTLPMRAARKSRRRYNVEMMIILHPAKKSRKAAKDAAAFPLIRRHLILPISHHRRLQPYRSLTYGLIWAAIMALLRCRGRRLMLMPGTTSPLPMPMILLILAGIHISTQVQRYPYEEPTIWLATGAISWAAMAHMILMLIW